jgi:RNA polymerase sigma factor (sigma-70 family)
MIVRMGYSSEEEMQRFLEYFKALYRPLCHFAWDILKDYDENASDMAASIVVEKIAICYLKGLFRESEEAIRKKLFTAVRCGCIDRIRKLKRRKRRLGRVTENMKTIEEPVFPEVWVTKALFLAVLNEIIPELKPEFRAVIKLNFMEELPMKEVALRLNIPEVTAYSYRVRGIQALRVKFEERMPGAMRLFNEVFGD